MAEQFTRLKDSFSTGDRTPVIGSVNVETYAEEGVRLGE